MVAFSKLAYGVVPSKPALRDLKKIQLPGRNPCLPTVYLYVGDSLHPGRQSQSPLQNTYVIFVDSSVEGKNHALKIAETLRIPYGRKAVMKKSNPGLLELFPGDFLFARERDSTGEPEEDILQCFVGDREQDSTTVRLDQARKTVLGSREDRCLHDKILFERDPRAKKTKPPGRCYGIGEMVEQPPATEAPPAAAKVYDGVLDDHQIMQKELLASLADFAISTFDQQAPVELQECLRDYDELINAPHIGCNRNYMWPSWQLNVAPAQRAEEEDSLAAVMGFYGAEHTDDNDSPASFSVMVVLSDLPDKRGWEPGRFHLLPLGVYVTLVPFLTVFFSGRLRHGGTAPLQPPSVNGPVPGWAYRLVAIGYPARRIVEGNVRHALAALPFQPDPLYLTQEMTGVKQASPSEIYVNRSNIAMDGIMTMDPQSHFEFFTRALLLLVIFLLRQLPTQYDVHIDSEQFLSSMSIKQEGEIIRGRPWRLAPTGRVSAIDSDQPRDPRARVRHRFFDEHYPHIVQGIPGAYAPPYTSTAITICRPKGKKRPFTGAAAKPRKKPRSSRKKLEHEARIRTSQLTMPMGQQDLEWLNQADCMMGRKVAVDVGLADDMATVEYVSNTSKADPEGYESLSTLSTLSSEEEWDELGEMEDVDESFKAEGRSNNRNNSGNGDSQANGEVIDKEFDELGGPETDMLKEIVGLGEEGLAEGRQERFEGDEADERVDTLAGAYKPNLGAEEDEDDLGDRMEDESEPHAKGNEFQDNPGPIESLGDSSRSARRCQFLSTFSTATLQYEIQVVNELRKHLPSVAPPALIDAFTHLDRVDYTSRLVISSLETAVSLLGAIGTLRRYGDASHVWRNASRQRVMFSEYYAFTQVTSYIRKECTRIAHQCVQAPHMRAPDDLDWLSRLTIYIADCVSAGRTITARSSTYFAAVMPSITFSKALPPRKGLRSFRDPEEVVSNTVDLVTEALCLWFQIPSDFKSETRAAFVADLLTHVGSGALLLASTWKVYDAIPPWLFDEGTKVGRGGRSTKAAKFHSSCLSEFRQALLESPIADSSSVQFALLSQLRLAYRHLLEDAKRYAAKLSGAPSLSTQSILPPLPPAPIEQGEIRPASVTAPEQPPPSTATIQSMVLFLRDSLEVVQSPNLNRPSPGQREMLRKLDFYMPLREKGPSRRIFRAQIDRTFAASRSGLFSLLVFRNILFNSQALLTAPDELQRVRFDDLQDFKVHLQALQAHFPGKSPDFFCNRNALGGQTQPGRVTGNAALFWSLSGRVQWAERGLSTSSLTFSAATSFVRKDLKERFKIPAFGLLSQYLLVADMCALGLVVPPTVEEMGVVIHRLNSGGAEGLRLLGYLASSTGKPPQAQVQAAFSNFFRDVNLQLTLAEQQDMEWGTISAEHCLCKLKRMTDKGFYRE